MEDLYERLREKLDGMGIGFPAVSGKDVAYLKKMFTEEHANVFLVMENRMQPLDEIAEKLEERSEETERKLREMDARGLVVSTPDNISPRFYLPIPWLSGWGDWSAFYVDHETAVLEHEYRKEAEFKGPKGGYKRNVFRTIPVHEALSTDEAKKLTPYDDVKKMVEDAAIIAVMKCWCDVLRMKRGEKKDVIYEPLERCMGFGKSAVFTVTKGFGRYISRDEALGILKKCAESGLVHNVADIKGGEWICNCGDHCGGNLSRRNVPWKFPDYEKTSNYCVAVDKDKCTGCGVCIDRCWFDAVVVNANQIAEINSNVCEGCGLCVGTCPTEALALRKREKTYVPPDTHPNMKAPNAYEMEMARYADIIKIKDDEPDGRTTVQGESA